MTFANLNYKIETLVKVIRYENICKIFVYHCWIQHSHVKYLLLLKYLRSSSVPKQDVHTQKNICVFPIPHYCFLILLFS